MITNYLLLAILLSLTLPYLYNLIWYSDSQRQKRHIKRKIEESYYKMWEIMWANEKTKNMREGFRVEYDRLQEELTAYPIRIENLKARGAEGDDEEIKKCEEKIAEQTKYCQMLTQRMDWADRQILGYEDDEGHHEGFVEAIDGYRELIKQLKGYRGEV